MTPIPDAAWKAVCPLSQVPENTGVAARFGPLQVAVFRVGNVVYALDNVDPVTGAGVLARGIIGDRKGVLKVSSPIYKQSYALETGQGLDDPGRHLQTFAARVSEEGWIEVLIPRREAE